MKQPWLGKGGARETAMNRGMDTQLNYRDIIKQMYKLIPFVTTPTPAHILLSERRDIERDTDKGNRRDK